MTVLTRRRRVFSRRRPARGDPAVKERGMVTAEIATALPVLALLMIIAVWAVAVASAHLRCGDAAREAARAAARGESPATIRQVADEVAPDGATVDVERHDGVVIIEVSSTVPLPGEVGASLPAPTVRGRAVALEETS